MTDPTLPAGSTPGGSTTALDAMRREVVDLHKQVSDLRALQASGRLWVWGSTALIILMFAVFMYATYHRIRGNFDQQAMQQAIRDHGADVEPMALSLLTSAGQDAMPVYRDAIASTFRTRGPAAATAAVARLRQVPEQSGKEFQDKVKVTFDAAIAKIEPEFKADYPSVSDEKRQQIMQSFVADQIESQNKRIATRVDQLYTNDLIHMQGVLDKYDLPMPAGPDGQRVLEKQFLHTMVALLDDQVEVALPGSSDVPPPSAETASMRVAPASRPTTAP